MVNGRATLIPIIIFAFLSNLLGGGLREQGKIAHDLSTPEGAVLSPEDAWRTKDLEKAVRCKDFRGEAEQILRDKPAEVRAEDIIAQTAHLLEMGYRAEIKKSGFPNMKGVTSTFIEKRELSPDRVEFTEAFRFPDGSSHTEKVQVRHTTSGWKVISAP
jgi:hypothetical protein